MVEQIPSLSSLSLGASLIARVESLMHVPFNELPMSDRDERETLASRRLREALSCMPFYGNRAAKAAAAGDEMVYWIGFWYSQVNTLYPPTSFFTHETVQAA